MLLKNIFVNKHTESIKYPVALTVVLAVVLGFLACRPQPTQDIEPLVPAPPQLEQLKGEPDTTEPLVPERKELIPSPPEPVTAQQEKPPLYTADQSEPTPVQTPPVAEDKQQSERPQAEKTQPHLAVAFHDRCADILSKYVNENGKVDYKTLNRRKPQLKRLLEAFADLDPEQYSEWPLNDKMAFWINAYNIKLLDIIIANYPIQSLRILRLLWPPTSIRHIKDIWTGYKFIVMEEEFTLSEIQDRFFYQQFSEPRIFFAISYASVSGPPLRNEPYSGHRLQQQLDDQIRKFLSQKHAFSIDRRERRVYLPAVLRSTWHGKRFIEKYGTDKKFKDKDQATRAVLNFITNYVSVRNKDFLETENYSIEYTRYDWRLNE